MFAKSIKLKRIFFWSALTISLTAVIITVITLNSRPLKPCVASGVGARPLAIIDAGHGGIDGGAVSQNGVKEADLNLAISTKIRDLMCLFGVRTVMTRTDNSSLDYDPESSIRDNKNADLKARLRLAADNPGYDFLSVHLNKFEQSQYYGAQVFYGGNNELSPLLAECIQRSFVSCIDPENKRVAKESHESIYLMKNISSPAVTIECGFLSNPDEAELLQSEVYQKQIALAVTKGYLDYIKER